MKFIRKLLYKFLRIENYLRLVSSVYLLLIKAGFYKRKYPEIFFLKQIIKEGDVCLDIGANLGYYSWFISKFCGKDGKLIAVEPVPLFGKIWLRNMKSSKFANFRLESCALGSENTRVKMATPEVNGVLHHGMTHVVNEGEAQQSTCYEVEMKIPDALFSALDRLNFVKIDVEGYEFIVFSNMVNTISKFHPVIQAELSGSENRLKVLALLESLYYKPHVLENQQLRAVNQSDIETGISDFYFI
ncbi:MAG: FkbM family methyltransferase [Bacteroidales bacterium]|nr:FkbM family methyltransferase [Bacteroidales bacterium]HOY38508.1 FkbM family methyltransferase [Bacteroidales bacterium]